MTQLCMKFSPKSYTLMAVMTSVSLLRGWKKAQAQLLHICINSLLLMQAAERALDIASLLLRESCTCCTQDFMKLACQGSDGLMAGAYLAGNIVEAGKAMWIIEHRSPGSLFAL